MHPPSRLPLAQRISLQLRLNQRLIVTATVQGKKREAAVGLALHRKKEHRCSAFVRIDWEGEKTTPESHPHLYIKGCPLLYDDPLLAHSIRYCIDIEDLGGLASLAPMRGLAHLPGRLVEFYQAVLAARDRLIDERNHAQQKLYVTQ